MKFLVFFIFIAFMASVPAQDKDIPTNIKGFQFSYHPYDYFLGGHIGFKRNRIEYQLVAQLGVERTFFQQRIYPQIGYQCGYHVVNYHRFHAGLLVRPMLSLLHVNRAAKHGFSYFEEVFFGGFIGCGNKREFRFSGGFGPGIEQKWSESKARFASWFSWNYFGQISWSHAL